MPSARSRSVVGQKQQQHRAPPSAAMSASSRWVACTAVNRSSSAPASASTPVGVEPYAMTARLVLGGLLGDVRMQRALVGRCPGRDPARRLGIDGANAVDRRPDPDPVTRGELVDAVGPGVGVGVGETQLDLAERLADAAVQVAGVQQGDPDPGLAGSLDDRLADLVRVRVRLAAGAVMQVVELADRRDPRQRHLPEGGPRQAQVGVGIEVRRKPRTCPRARPRSCRRRARPDRGALAGRRASGRWRSPATSARRGAPPPPASTPRRPRPMRCARPRSRRPLRRSPSRRRARRARTNTPCSCPDPLHEPADPLDEGVAVEALELLPGAQRRRIADAVEEEDAVEMVDLVLERPGRETTLDLVDGRRRRDRGSGRGR